MSVHVLLADGGPIPISRLADTWRLSLGVLVPAAVLVALFAQAFARLRRRGRTDHAGWDRAALFLAAVAIGTLALVSPLDAAGEQYLLSAHMVQHVVIADAAPALALVALRGPLLFFLLPAAILEPLARFRPLRLVLAQLARPKVALVLWGIVIGSWHVPALYDYTLTHRTVHDIEHLCFVIVGVLVWMQIVDPARRRELTVPQRIAFAAALFAAGQVLSYVLIFGLHPWYPSYADESNRLFGWSPTFDQQLAGLAMMAEQLLALGTACAILLIPFVRSKRLVSQTE